MRRWGRVLGLVMLSGGMGALALSGTGAAASATVDVPAKVTSMAAAVKVGQDIYMRDTFGGMRTCNTCHINGGRTPGKLPSGATIPSLVGAAAVFPRFIPGMGRVITLEQQLQKCIKGGLGGTPPAVGSVAMNDLAAYVTSLSKGQVMGSQFGSK